MGGVKNKWGSNIYYYITRISFLIFMIYKTWSSAWVVWFEEEVGGSDLI